MDHDDPEQVEIRKGQGDPIVMYLIVRESLGMGAGKIGAQCAHAAQMILLAFTDWQSADDEDYTEISLDDGDVMQTWLNSSFRKVVLKADDKEWEKLKALPLSPERLKFVVRDAGLTEVEAGSETVMALWPMLRSKAPKLVRRLQVL